MSATKQPTHCLYQVQLIDTTFAAGYREETVLGTGHVIDALTLTIYVNDSARQIFNWHWVLGFGYDEIGEVMDGGMAQRP